MIFRKTGESSVLMVEATKASRAFEIGRDSGLFYVPKVVNFDAKAGVLEFERLNGLATLFDLAVRNDHRLFSLSEKTGQALAVVHSQLILPDEMRYDLPLEWMDNPDENVFIHGDFATVNMGFHGPSGGLVIMDWSAAPIMGRIPTFGSQCFDILWFTHCTFSYVPNKRILSWDAEGMTDAFLKGYAREASAEKINRLQDYLSKIYRLQRKHIWYQATRRKSPLRKATYLFSQAVMHTRFHAYLRSLKSKRFQNEV